MRPFIIWRRLPITATTRFGAEMQGGFPDIIHTYLYFFGTWEPGITRLFRNHIRSGDTVIDIGANVGTHTMLAASLVGKSGHVYAIEASPTIFAKLSVNLHNNHLSQVEAFNVAVSDVHGFLTVYLSPEANLGGTTTIASEAEKRGAVQEARVEARPLGDILSRQAIAAARLIKIDVEGAEWPVLLGMRDLIASLHEECVILLEITKDSLAPFNVDTADILALFGAEGWLPFEIANSYKPDFYIASPRCVLTTEIDFDAPVLDLGFARPATLRNLLAADRS